ncbi:MAG: hypothetical protein LBU32_14755 [Clostridiales bacterium]|jgi:hypothetical protein|nr:hypothetical protein [Clostridiales bacterium]
MKILSVRRGFASDHSSTSYEFLAVDKPLSKNDILEVSKLSRRADPTSRQVNFIYHVDGYDIPGGWEKLMEKYYDIMYREDYDWWTLSMAWIATPGQYDELRHFAFDGEHDEASLGINVSNDKRRITVTLSCTLDTSDIYYGYDEDGETEAFETDDPLLNLLTRIRQQLVRGDYRALYAVWEKYGDVNGELAPPKPQDLKTGQGAVKNFKKMLI